MVRTAEGKTHAYPRASATLTSSGVLVVRNALGDQIAVYHPGQIWSYDLRPDTEQP